MISPAIDVPQSSEQCFSKGNINILFRPVFPSVEGEPDGTTVKPHIQINFKRKGLEQYFFKNVLHKK